MNTLDPDALIARPLLPSNDIDLPANAYDAAYNTGSFKRPVISFADLLSPCTDGKDVAPDDTESADETSLQTAPAAGGA